MEDVAPAAVRHAAANVLAVLLVRDRGADFAHRTEIVEVHARAPEQALHACGLRFRAFRDQFVQGQRVAEMVEFQREAEEDIEQVRGVVLRARLILDGYVLEVASGVKCREAPKLATRQLWAFGSLHPLHPLKGDGRIIAIAIRPARGTESECAHEVPDEAIHRVGRGNGFLHAGAVWQGLEPEPMGDAHLGERFQGDERA